MLAQKHGLVFTNGTKHETQKKLDQRYRG